MKRSVFYSIYEGTKEYSKLTSLTVAKAVLAKAYVDYTVTVIIDGLNDTERDIVQRELKMLKIKYRKIRGMKDEQNIFLRLSDAIAGFLRDAYMGEEYTEKLLRQFELGEIVKQT